MVNTASTNGMKIESIDASKALENFSENTWGFLSPTGGDYQPVPSLLSPENLLRTTTKTSGNDNFNFKIGMKLSSNLESGSYANKLVVSIISNPYTPIAIMTEGPDFNAKLKSLEDFDNLIEHFKKSSVAPAASMNVVNIEDEESDYEIKLWLDSADNTAYYYTGTEKVYLNTDSSNMFHYLPDLSSLDLSSFDTSQVTDMRYMFSELSMLADLNLSNFDTSKVTNMEGMFSDMSKLTSLDLSSFDTAHVINMCLMFSFASKLVSLNLSNFNTSQVTLMSRMFANMPNLANLDLSNFDTSQVTEMTNMFYNTPNLTSLDLSTFNTSKVTDMNSIFALANSYVSKDKLEKIYVNNNFNISKLKISPLMFNNRKKLRGGAGSYLTNPSQADKTWLRIDEPVNGRPGYFTRKP